MSSTGYILVKFPVVCCIAYGTCESVGNPGKWGGEGRSDNEEGNRRRREQPASYGGGVHRSVGGCHHGYN